MITYYKTECGRLIRHNSETNVYIHKNTIERCSHIISEEDFIQMTSEKIRKQEFNKLLNVYFKDVKHKWEYDFKRFKKLPNFEDDGFSFSSNYKLGLDVPYHMVGDSYKERCILVYHQGHVYYHTISYNGYKQGILICPRTFKMVKWCKLKHCAPIKNLETNKIC